MSCPYDDHRIQDLVSPFLSEYQIVMAYSGTLPSNDKESYSRYLIQALRAGDFRVASWMMHEGVTFPSNVDILILASELRAVVCEAFKQDNIVAVKWIVSILIPELLMNNCYMLEDYNWYMLQEAITNNCVRVLEWYIQNNKFSTTK